MGFDWRLTQTGTEARTRKKERLGIFYGSCLVLLAPTAQTNRGAKVYESCLSIRAPSSLKRNPLSTRLVPHTQFSSTDEPTKLPRCESREVLRARSLTVMRSTVTLSTIVSLAISALCGLSWLQQTHAAPRPSSVPYAVATTKPKKTVRHAQALVL